MLLVGKIEITKCLLNLSLVNPRQNAEAVLETYELFINEDINYVTS
jgi:hypothetical protein